MLYMKLVIFITQHQEVENHFHNKALRSHLLFKATLTATHTLFMWPTHFAQVQMDKTGSHHVFTLLFLWLQNTCAILLGFTDTNLQTPSSPS